MIYSNRELREMGLVRTSDGALLDNRDGFYDDAPDHLSEYDTRTMVAVSKSLLWKIFDVIGRIANEERARELIEDKTREVGTNPEGGAGAGVDHESVERAFHASMEGIPPPPDGGDEQTLPEWM